MSVPNFNFLACLEVVWWCVEVGFGVVRLRSILVFSLSQDEQFSILLAISNTQYYAFGNLSQIYCLKKGSWCTWSYGLAKPVVHSLSSNFCQLIKEKAVVDQLYKKTLHNILKLTESSSLGTSGWHSSRSAFRRFIVNNVSGHYKLHYYSPPPFVLLRCLLFS